MREEPCIGAFQAIVQTDPSAPAKRLQAAHIQKLPRRAIRFRAIEFDAPREASDLSNRLCQLPDGAISSNSDVDVGHHGLRGRPILLWFELHHVHARISHVVHVEELSPRLTTPPNGDGW